MSSSPPIPKDTFVKKVLFLILLGCFLSTPLCLGQSKFKDFEEVSETLLVLKPKTYEKINAALKYYVRDTTLLNKFYQSALEESYLEGQAYVLNKLGAKYRNLSRYKRALNLHERALKVSEEADSDELRVLSLNMFGVVYTRTDAIKNALDHHQKALELAESLVSPSIHIKRNINIALNGIGNLYKTLGQYDLAIVQFKKALKLERELDNKLGLAINNQNIGDCLELKGQLEEALEYYRKSLAFNEEINSEYGKVICKNSIAQIYLKQGMPNASLVLLQNIKPSAEKIKDNFITSSVYINLGWSLAEVGDYSSAERHMVEGLQLAEKSNIPNQILSANQHLSDLETKKGNFKKSLEFYKKADRYRQDIINERNLRYMNDMIVEYDVEKKNNQISVLAQENEIVKLRLRKNQTTILVSALTLGLLGSMLFILYRQYQSDNEKKVLSLEQNMLRSQMNPHFLFNSLNSIKLYIINNEKKNAVHYLNKFSKLVRRILEGSSLKETELAEELETVELYLNIENIRFSEEINYEITIDEEINPEKVKIPSLVLQPFLENAIWHGLSSKEGEKNIWLHVSRYDDNYIEIAITDNGVGREASQKLKESRVLKRKSVGIDITKERLANFSKDYQYNFDFKIEDLFDENENPCGTKVILKIPTT